MLNLFKNEKITISISSPLIGDFVKLSDVNDPVFSQGLLGVGYAIKPKDGVVYSPFAGTIEVLFPTKHAIGLKDENGIEILIHIGIDTVELKGQFYISYIEQGQKVKKGEKLIEFNIDEIMKAGFDVTTMIVVTNASSFNNVIINEKEFENLNHEVIFVQI